MKNKLTIVGSFLDRYLPCLPNNSCETGLGKHWIVETEGEYLEAMRMDLLQFILAKHTGSKCHIGLWMEHVVVRQENCTTQKQYS